MFPSARRPTATRFINDANVTACEFLRAEKLTARLHCGQLLKVVLLLPAVKIELLSVFKLLLLRLLFRCVLVLTHKHPFDSVYRALLCKREFKLYLVKTPNWLSTDVVFIGYKKLVFILFSLVKLNVGFHCAI